MPFKSIEIMINIKITGYRLFVLDTCLCWNKWKITVDRFSCKWTEWFSKECKTTCYVIVNWHIHIWNSRLLYQKCTPRKGLSFIYFHAMDILCCGIYKVSFINFSSWNGTVLDATRHLETTHDRWCMQFSWKALKEYVRSRDVSPRRA